VENNTNEMEWETFIEIKLKHTSNKMDWLSLIERRMVQEEPQIGEVKLINKPIDGDKKHPLENS
jgi:hypothetical protein